GDGPFGIAFDGTDVWVSNFFSQSVMKLRRLDGALVGTYKTGDGPSAVYYHKAVGIIVVNNGSNNLMQLRQSDGVAVSTSATATGPINVAFDGTNLWVASTGSNRMTVKNTYPSDGTSGTSPGVPRTLDTAVVSATK
ncbi:MAG TPA: hypothetical protein VD861_08200, partial [Pyrinomonadaceae bacterium]|nr:hypothetical protein [Pyrinomonadaceae bacterium]